MIRLCNVHKTYDGGIKFHALKGISLVIEDGAFVSIMGSSGSGKSTLLNILGLLDSFDEGEYMFDNKSMKNIGKNQAADFRNTQVGFVFQSFNLIQTKTALENVALPLFYQNKNKKDCKHAAYIALDKMGLKEWANHTPGQLSGGQKQRVAIARAIITHPKVILADEPTGALDTHNSNEVMQILKDLNKKGLTIIVVTHDINVANYTNRIICLKDGYIEHIERIR